MDAPPVQYVTTSDGYSIAYAVSGSGRPFVFAPQLFSHVEVYWKQETFVRPWLEGLSSRFQLVQYDGRGQGMSTRGLPETFSAADWKRDLETVVERLKLDRFVLMGPSATPIAVPYAAAHPERVEALILAPLGESFLEPARKNWERFLFEHTLGSADERRAAIDRLKHVWTQQDFLTYLSAGPKFDVLGSLPAVRAPTLVLHPRDYLNVRHEESVKVAASIPDARMVFIDGATQLGDPVQGLKAIDDFLASLPPHDEQAERPATAAGAPPDGLSAREVEVLRLIAAGKSSREVGEALVLSVRTVERHIANIYLKTDTHGRAQATAYALAKGLL